MKIVDLTVGPKATFLSTVPNGSPFKYARSHEQLPTLYIKLGLGGLDDSIKKLLDGRTLAMKVSDGTVAVFNSGEHYVTEFEGVLNISWKGL